MLCKPLTTVAEVAMNMGEQSNNEELGYRNEEADLDYTSVTSKENLLKQGCSLHELEPRVLLPLQELISLIHGRVNQSQLGETSESQPVSTERGDVKQTVNTNLFSLDEDPIAQIIWTFHPLILCSVFLSMAHSFPRTLEALVLHALTPVGTEVLTQKFDEMDKLITEEDRYQFYQKFYSVFDNQFSAMEALLNGKEAFASIQECTRSVSGNSKFIGLKTSTGRDCGYQVFLHNIRWLTQ